MAEPIDDFDLAEISHMLTTAPNIQGSIYGWYRDSEGYHREVASCDENDLRGLLARLDLAERRLAAVCGVLRRSHEQIKQDVEYAAKNDTSELRLTLREAEVREGIVRSIRADVEQAANG